MWSNLRANVLKTFDSLTWILKNTVAVATEANYSTLALTNA